MTKKQLLEMASDHQKTSGHKRKAAIDVSLESLQSSISQDRNIVEYLIMQSTEDKRRREEREERRREEREAEERRYREERESRDNQRQREMMMFMATLMKREWQDPAGP